MNENTPKNQKRTNTDEQTRSTTTIRYGMRPPTKRNVMNNAVCGMCTAAVTVAGHRRRGRSTGNIQVKMGTVYNMGVRVWTDGVGQNDI